MREQSHKTIERRDQVLSEIEVSRMEFDSAVDEMRILAQEEIHEGIKFGKRCCGAFVLGLCLAAITQSK